MAGFLVVSVAIANAETPTKAPPRPRPRPPLSSAPQIVSQTQTVPQTQTAATSQAVITDPNLDFKIGEDPISIDGLDPRLTRPISKAPTWESLTVQPGQVFITESHLKIYDLDRKGRPVKGRQIKPGTRFKIVRPNDSDSRILLDSGEEVFTKKETLLALINEGSWEETSGGMTQFVPSALIASNYDQELDEFDDRGLEGTVPEPDCSNCAMNPFRSAVAVVGDLAKEAAEKAHEAVVGPRTYEFIHPVDNVRITSRVGWRKHPVLKYRKFHAGTDYGVPTGTPVRAAQDGVVESVTRKGAGGLAVKIKHSNGYTSVYMHLSKFKVKKGQKVKKGDIIALSGNTGRSTGPHLHFGLYKKGEAIDPIKAKLLPPPPKKKK